MTSDSDDVSPSADQKPKGALRPDEVPSRHANDADGHAHCGGAEHRTGEAQAAVNRSNEPPA
jgi:hypothetical protein